MLREVVEVMLYSFFNLRAKWGSVVNATPQALCPPGKRPGTHYVGGLVGSRAGLDGCEKSGSHRDSIPEPFNPYGIAIPTTLTRPKHITRTGIYTYHKLLMNILSAVVHIAT